MSEENRRHAVGHRNQVVEVPLYFSFLRAFSVLSVTP
jgi:hypothetical protein